jgi:O-acetyl-ADP-ribose deacetylase (regulator of RNase III)
MIHLKTGDIFETNCMYIVNPVNIVGVMGKGLAKEFKKKHPNYFLQYKRQCQNDKVMIGKIKKYYVGYEHDSKYGYIVNIPTKKHFKDPSKLAYVRKGLEDFAHKYKDLGITSIAFPLLGTGNGGLDKKKVLKLMLDTLKECIIDIEIYVDEDLIKEKKR